MNPTDTRTELEILASIEANLAKSAASMQLAAVALAEAVAAFTHPFTPSRPCIDRGGPMGVDEEAKMNGVGPYPGGA